MKMSIDSLKEEISITTNKKNNLELQNKKLNKDYETLNKDFNSMKNENEKMKMELDEQKANIFNYQKELSKNNSKNNNKFIYLNSDLNEYNDLNKFGNNNYSKKNSYKNNEDKNDDKYDYTNEFHDEKNSFKKPDYSNNYNEGLNKKNYSNYNYDYYSSSSKNSLQELESRLSYFISEKKKYENELLKMPEHPRNLNEIKIKKELNDKINNSEREINTIRSRIRNYEY
jgi:hypothetical protein